MDNAIGKKHPMKRFFAIRGIGQVITVTVGLMILVAVFALTNERFITADNIQNLSRQIVPFVLIGLAQSFVLITGNIDLSIGSVVGMSCMMSATLMQNGMSPIPAIAITMVSSLIVGVVNGIFVAQFKLPPFIATLGTMTICRGVAKLVNGNVNTNLITPGDPDLLFQKFFYSGKLLGLYNGVWIVIVLFIVFNIFLYKKKSGQHIFAIGSNVNAAKLSGVNVVTTTVKAYMVSAFLSCIAGLVVCATTASGTMNAGNSYELYAVAASVIGGVSTLGGSGLLFGTVIGACIWGVLQNGLQFAKTPDAYKDLIVGTIVTVSVLLDVLLRSGGMGNLKKMFTNFFGTKYSEKANG